MLIVCKLNEIHHLVYITLATLTTNYPQKVLIKLLLFIFQKNCLKNSKTQNKKQITILENLFRSITTGVVYKEKTHLLNVRIFDRNAIAMSLQYHQIFYFVFQVKNNDFVPEIK